MMAMRGMLDLRVLRRYWPFFLVVLVILSVQILLSVFIYSSSLATEDNDPSSSWLPKDSHGKGSVSRSSDYLIGNVADCLFLKKFYNGDKFRDVVSNEVLVRKQSQDGSEDDDDNDMLSSVLERRHLGLNRESNKQQSYSRTSASNKGMSSIGKANLPSNSKSINYDELDFKPRCEISTKEAISAINRATTQQCKEEIADITCLMQNDELYPKTLPRYCHLKGKFIHHVQF